MGMLYNDCLDTRFIIQASLAQLVERGTSNAEVTGSTPLGGSIFCLFTHMVSFCLDLASQNALQDCLMVLLLDQDKACELDAEDEAKHPKLLASRHQPPLSSKLVLSPVSNINGSLTKHIAKVHFLILASYSRTTITIPDPESSGSRRAVSTTMRKP